MRPLRLLPPSLLSALTALAAGPNLKEGNAADAPRLSPAEQQKAFTLAPGFAIELVTSEEQGAEKPVALNFDDSGRLWTMTATEYPLDANDKGQAELAKRKWKEGGRDRVLVIDHPLAPGPHSPRVFADGLVMPMSVLPHRDGALVAHGPEILRLRDTDGDGRADERTVLITGFGIQDSHTLAHNLMWMPDGSVLSAQGILNEGTITTADGVKVAVDCGKFATFRPDGTGFRLYAAGLNNTWGLFLTRLGQLWGQEANVFDHPVAPLEEGVHLHGWKEKPYLPGAVWQPGVGAVDVGGTGLSGLAVSDDPVGGFPPEWRGPFLLANPVAGSINSLAVEPAAAGGHTVRRGPDLVTCADKRFRPVHIAFGPDSCLYIVDWYNPIISHNEVPRDHPARDRTSGRIWRVRHAGQTRREAPDVAAAKEQDLPLHLQSSNTWEMRAAWRQIVERKAEGLVPRLSELALSGPDDARVHALWCLAGLGRIEAPVVTAALAAPSADVRREAVRALTTAGMPAARSREWLRALARETDPSVRNEVARHLRAAPDTSADDLAFLLGWFADADPRKVKGGQGETVTPAAYPQTFLNFQIHRALEAHSLKAAEVTGSPQRLAALPYAAQVALHLATYRPRFADGTIQAKDLHAPDEAALHAALGLAGEIPRAATLLREHVNAVHDPHILAAQALAHPDSSSASLRAFAGPLALRLLGHENPVFVANGLDLAAHALTAGDSQAFVRKAEETLARHPGLRLHVTRTAVAAGIRDAEFFAAACRAGDARARAAAWPGWFESVPAAEKPGVEKELRDWVATLSAADADPVLDELVSTTVGAHFALNNAFPTLLAADPARLARFAGELAERVPGHGRLREVTARVEQARAARSKATQERIRTLETALDGGTLKPNRAAGEALFTGLCLTCHSAGGKGVGFAPPLDGSGKRDRPSLLLALLEPEAAVENVFRPHHIRLREGGEVEGFLAATDGNRVTLRFMGGATRTMNLLRAHTARPLPGHSLMPDLGAGLNDQSLADLLEYLKGL